ncbi:phosphoribosyltransferase family protein [Dactylosporangium salmoneum]|uniref:Phosphoribosyltransferase family protein n=1 Tax=Dactylosporangium salmoneum TaxID=53361 RepID=A0ABP5U1R2_9ACTN
MQFADRAEAGRHLAERLRREPAGSVVLGVPGGGVPVAVEVAAGLGAPLDPLVVQRLGVSFQPELTMAAVGPGGALAVNPEVLRSSGTCPDELAAEVDRARAEAADRTRHLLTVRPTSDLRGRRVIVVDDAIVTGATARAASRAARVAGAAHVTVAVPVAAGPGLAGLPAVADRVVHLDTATDRDAAGGRYADFRPVPDDEVVRLLAGPGQAPAGRRPADPPEDDGRLAVPPGAAGTVVLAHTSRGAGLGPRCRWIAGRLREAGLATLSLYLLRREEELDWLAARDVGLLADRLAAGLGRLRADATAAALPIGLFVSGSAAAAALAAAAGPSRDMVAAVVCHDGRPDLAWRDLPGVRAPTLLVAGGRNEYLLELNRVAHGLLPGGDRLAVLRGAGHLVQEPGALATLTRLAVGWFGEHLGVR